MLWPVLAAHGTFAGGVIAAMTASAAAASKDQGERPGAVFSVRRVVRC